LSADMADAAEVEAATARRVWHDRCYFRSVMSRRGETTLWTCPQGIRCVLLRYDETRYQLKLVRQLGTIKADLFAGYANALAASRQWREEFDITRGENCL
jgi:hypothetical protein